MAASSTHATLSPSSDHSHFKHSWGLKSVLEAGPGGSETGQQVSGCHEPKERGWGLRSCWVPRTSFLGSLPKPTRMQLPQPLCHLWSRRRCSCWSGFAALESCPQLPLRLVLGVFRRVFGVRVWPMGVPLEQATSAFPLMLLYPWEMQEEQAKYGLPSQTLHFLRWCDPASLNTSVKNIGGETLVGTFFMSPSLCFAATLKPPTPSIKLRRQRGRTPGRRWS